jgi:DNA gyrase/topoisomerase IV subunit A
VLDALADAFGRLEDISRTVRQSRSGVDALAALMSPAFGFSERQARLIVDLSFRHQTQEYRQSVAAERDALRRAVG